MGKIAIVTDSSSGISQAMGTGLGIFVLPMPFMIDGRPYLDGKDLTESWFYERQNADSDIMSSQPAPVDVTALWDELLKDHDQIVHIPLSSGLSNSCATAMMLAGNYDGKVQVVDNQRISITQRRSVMEAIRMAEMGYDAAKIKRILEETKLESSIYITLVTLKYLKKGGRLTPAAAALGTVLRLKPVLQIQGEKLDSFYKARTMNQAKKVMIDAIKSDIENRFGGLDAKDVYIDMAYTNNRDAALEWQKEVMEAFPGFEIGYLDPLSLNVACHIGEGALAVTATRKLHLD